jgi:kynurenine formamidase
LIRAAALVDFAPRDVVDLSLDIYPGMTALGGAVPTFWSRASHELTAFFYRHELSYQTTSMLLSEHAGTHIDSPYHFDPEGVAIEGMALDAMFARARLLDLRVKQPLQGIGPGDLDAALQRLGERLEPGDAAVVWTDHSRNYSGPTTRTIAPSSRPRARPGWRPAVRGSWRRTSSGWTSRSTTSPRCTTACCERASPSCRS